MPFGFTEKEIRVLRKLNTPRKIQDFLETLPINFEEKGDTLMSPRRVLREKTAHCFEGAIFAAAALHVNGQRPLIFELCSMTGDDDHILTLFQSNGRYGAISKTNHAVLRYREPVYKTMRELALSFFHEYFLHSGKKTMRSFSYPVDLTRHAKKDWMTTEEDLWYLYDVLNKARHENILDKKSVSKLRLADDIEIAAGKLIQWKEKG